MTKAIDFRNLDFLLDTSAVRAMSRWTISSLAEEGIRLFSSPYSCWEILCHIEEPNAFHDRKIDLEKLKFTTILEDQEYLNRQSIQLVTNPSVGDRELVKHCLSQLEVVNNVDDFYSSNFYDSLGTERNISGVAKRANDILLKYESEYSLLLAKIVGRIQELSVRPNDTTEHARLIFSLLKGELAKYTDPENPDREIWSKVLDHYLIFYGYMFHRALICALSDKRIEPNDFEDANICKHLCVTNSFKMVTADKGMRNALEKLQITLEKSPELGIQSKIAVYAPSDLQAVLIEKQI